ncbi:Protein of unknown function DUF2015 [Kalmanozyma brasiliensis GHG001]|uniref:Protein of unknown function DUF2015 n=1 Tax=Kalmanozyma brasiliensis (strain GHG001) TaxID=1365824 RepID=UPI002867ED63|nr:Protein of unknown function DUF2015 [Kalmanozyma brasiliensis GHG001]KAF6766943.1 Protein of unknown function DUF2015 [Kalmanozyma brasiliensis GHG001]
MYHSLLTASFFLALVILLYRNRQFFVSLLPESVSSRMPASFQPSLPPLSATPPSNRGTLLNRLLSPFTRTPYTPLPTSWNSQLSAGLSSSLFDISTNIADGDTRTGLDETGAQDVQTIMRDHGVGFDQARLIRHKQVLRANNIDPNTGLPLDSKAVTSLGGRPGGSRG